LSTNSVIPLTNLLATLHTYPNLLLWMCGHTHQNNIIPQPSPYPDRPEYGFWEVETASLRISPRSSALSRSSATPTIPFPSVVTDIDPEVTPNSPADVSRGYAVGAARIFMIPCTSLTDTNSYAHNAELLKLLTPPMQTKIAGYGGPLGHNVAIDRIGTGVVINFLGELQSADTLSRTVERRYEHQPIRGIGCERCEVLPRSYETKFSKSSASRFRYCFRFPETEPSCR
jgi:hypothetical protein